MIITIDRNRHRWSFEGGIRAPDIALDTNTTYLRFVYNPPEREVPIRSGYRNEVNDEGDLLLHNLWLGQYLLVWTTRTKLGRKRISRYKRWCKEQKRRLSYKSWIKNGYEWDCKIQDRDEIMGY